MIVTSESAPKDNTAASDNSLTSSPATISFATDRPPSVCKEPSVVLVASVVSSVFNIPLAVIAVAVSVLAPTIVPDTSKFAFTSANVAFNSISSVALMSSIALLGALIN